MPARDERVGGSSAGSNALSAAATFVAAIVYGTQSETVSGFL